LNDCVREKERERQTERYSDAERGREKEGEIALKPNLITQILIYFCNHGTLIPEGGKVNYANVPIQLTI